MGDFTLVKGAEKLDKELPGLKKKYDETNDMLHISVCSRIFHASSTGDIRRLNDLYAILTDTHQGMLRNFLRIIQTKQHPEANCIGFAGGQFVMITSDQDTGFAEKRSYMDKLMETVYLNPPEFDENDKATQAPDGSAYRRWIERSAVGDAFSLIQNSTILAQINNLNTRAKGETDKVVSMVHPKVREVLGKFAEELKSVYDALPDEDKKRISLDQARLEELKTKDEKTKDKAKAA